MSFLRTSYYQLKPFLPLQLRLNFRRRLADRIRQRSREIWPINAAAGEQPKGWPGWPDKKQFAVVLTHDVEGPRGLAKCRELVDLERILGFRSSFNFIPEGSYEVPSALREFLVSNGFEVGVHDLKHDGKLYRSRRGFSNYAKTINAYLKQWNAVGFRSGFMHHNLEWLHALDIQYDLSTFDTDPFEPQPEPHSTIFPFWVCDHTRTRKYLELPYTLPQDSTLFLVLEEESPSIWETKLNWIAEQGGMVLLNTHPDYMSFGSPRRESYTYPAEFYSGFLKHLTSRYCGQYWSGVPKELTTYLLRHGQHLRAVHSGSRKKVWIDLDNTPHVPFFKPIIQELESKGYKVAVTSRSAFQVCELATEMGVKHTSIGRHYGKNPVAKFLGLLIRALQFIPFVFREKPALAVSHGARSQILLCNLLGIPTVLLADYEHAKILPFLRPTWLFVPEVIPLHSLAKCAKNLGQYPGIKEDVYVPGFQPSQRLAAQIELDLSKIIVTVRPPANEAHYRSPESDRLFEATMSHLTSRSDVQTILLPRNSRQFEAISHANPEWFVDRKVVVPDAAVDGLDLIWHSDLVVSGGGTMNREAAALGVPVYSIFRGKSGAVDRHLQEQGRLTMLKDPADIPIQIKLSLRHKNGQIHSSSSKARDYIIHNLEEILSSL